MPHTGQMVGKMSEEQIVEQDLEEEIATDTDQEEVPLFMQEEDEQESSPDGVPVSTHVAMKRKLKGKLRDSDEELQALRTENEQLKQSSAPATVVDAPKRPKLDDFETDAEYDTALEKFENERTKALFDNAREQEKQKSAGRKFQERVTASVDSHFDRAAELVEKHSISPEVYQQATETVRGAMDDINPGMKTFDTFVDVMRGYSSDKTVFSIGRNKAKLAMLKETLHDDKSGLRTAFILGVETARLNGVKARTSQAPVPGSQITGDEQGGKNVAAMKKKFNKLCEAGKTAEAFAIRRKAKKDKIEVKDW